ncbi:MAG: signal peptide peptidase SppA [Acidobacteriota bacterium]|nr:signal peptide peptidase SppA [Acidobacteriota bacterium]
MKNFLIGLFTGVLVVVLTGIILVFVVMRVAASFNDPKPTVADGSTLILKLEGDVPEKAAPEIPLPFFEGQSPMTLHQVWATLRKAAVDSRIKAVIFEPRRVGAGWAKMQEIHQELEEFKKTGKPLVAFLRNPGGREYYLATACDRVYMTPEDSLDLKGLRVEAMFLKNTLDKLGVKMDVIHAGKYKDAGDMLTQTSMSPETREVLNQVLDQYYGDLVTTIATGRKKQQDEVRAIIDKGPYRAAAALSNGLVDVVAFEDQVEGEMQKRLNRGDLKKVSHKTYLKVTPQSVGSEGGKRIAFIVGEGEITRGTGEGPFGSDEGFTSGGFIKLLKQVENDSSIKAAIVRVNSPGGDGIASDDILHEVKNLSRKKPLVISMSDLAASGGYFVAMTGDPIVAYPNTLTGSIGVLMGRLNLHGLYDKLGIQKQLLTRGRYAALDSDYEDLTADERQKLREDIDDFYKAFVSRVAEGRKRPYDQIEPLAQGRVWLGAQGKQNGLVDELGGIDRAIELAKQKAHIPANEKITLVTYPPKRNILDMIVNRGDESAAVELKIRQVLGAFPVQSWTQGGMLKVMPYTITVH